METIPAHVIGKHLGLEEAKARLAAAAERRPHNCSKWAAHLHVEIADEKGKNPSLPSVLNHLAGDSEAEFSVVLKYMRHFGPDWSAALLRDLGVDVVPASSDHRALDQLARIRSIANETE